MQGDGGGSVVHLQPVELGQVEGNTFEVKSGLKPGVVVAVGSVQLLRDGQPVEPRPASEGQGGREGPGVGGGSDAGE
jgi:multidrug efflux pump subunit AcrA (membrane-fusion protein)